MPNTPVPAAATGLPSATLDRAAVMRAAWALFRERYGYPRIPFRSIGRDCFAHCLAVAWAKAKEAAPIAAIPAESKARLAASLRGQIEDLQFLEKWQQASARRATIQAQLAQLGA